jgi:hypothetical protein
LAILQQFLLWYCHYLPFKNLWVVSKRCYFGLSLKYTNTFLSIVTSCIAKIAFFFESLPLYFLQQLNIVGKLKSNSLLPQVPQYGHHLLKKVFVLFSWDCNTLCFAFHSFICCCEQKWQRIVLYQLFCRIEFAKHIA